MYTDCLIRTSRGIIVIFMYFIHDLILYHIPYFNGMRWNNRPIGSYPPWIKSFGRPGFWKSTVTARIWVSQEELPYIQLLFRLSQKRWHWTVVAVTCCINVCPIQAFVHKEILYVWECWSCFFNYVSYYCLYLAINLTIVA